MKHSRYDGTLLNAEVSLNNYNIAGKYYIQAIVRDITDRKQAEEGTPIFRAAPVRHCRISFLMPRLVIDKGGKVIAWNRAIEAMTGSKQQTCSARVIMNMPSLLRRKKTDPN